MPRRLREALGVKPGDYLALTPTADGVLITAAPDVPERRPEAALVGLGRSLGEQLERDGIVEEEHLDDAIVVAKREAYEQRYGERAC